MLRNIFVISTLMLGTSQFLPAFEKEQNLDPTQRIFHDLCKRPFEIRRRNTTQCLKAEILDKEPILTYTTPVKNDPHFSWVLRKIKEGEYCIQNQGTGVILENKEKRYQFNLKKEEGIILLEDFDTNQIYKRIDNSLFSDDVDLYISGPNLKIIHIEKETRKLNLEKNPNLKFYKEKYFNNKKNLFFKNKEEASFGSQSKPKVVFDEVDYPHVKASETLFNDLQDRALKEIESHFSKHIDTFILRNGLEKSENLRIKIEITSSSRYEQSLELKLLGSHEVQGNHYIKQSINDLNRDVVENLQDHTDSQKAHEVTGQRNNVFNDTKSFDDNAQRT